jgi:hypothetical protein
MASTIVAMIATVVAVIRMCTVHGMTTTAAMISPISPAAPKNTAGGREQADDTDYV